MCLQILFICKAYYPSVSPSGSLIKEIAESLAENNEIHILCHDKNSVNQANFIHNKVNIHRYELNDDNRGIIKKLFSTHYYNKKTVDIIKKNIISFLYQYQIDMIIPTTYEEIVACSMILNKIPVKHFAPFLLERLFNRRYFGKYDLLYRFREYNNKNILKKFANNNCIIFSLPPVKGYINSALNISYKNYIIIEHPLTIFSVNNKISSDSFNISYLGGLDLKIRNPENFLKYILPYIPKKYNINFYGYGNCKKLIMKYVEQYDNFHFYGSVDSEKAHEIQLNSDILLTFGNKNNDVVSSKLFDCISSRKPIIHFYQVEDDPYIKYLSYYSLSICLPLNKLHEGKYRKLFLEFVLENKGKEEPVSGILNSFKKNTLQYITNQILHAYNNI